MSPKVTIGSDTVHIILSQEAETRKEERDIIADYDLEGDPIGFEALDLKSKPLSSPLCQESPYLKASYDADNHALSVWFKKAKSSDQEELTAVFGFSGSGSLVSVRYEFQRGNAARVHGKR